MDAPRSGNPGLAYGFRATPERAIRLDVHHKKPSLRRHFLSLLYLFSLLLSLHPRPFRLRQLLSLGLDRSLVRHFSNPPPHDRTSLVLLYFTSSDSIVQPFVLWRLQLLKLTLSSHSHAFGGPPTHHSHAFAHSCLSPLVLLHCKLSLFSRKVLACFTSGQRRLKGQDRYPSHSHTSLRGPATLSPAPDSPMACTTQHLISIQRTNA